jgi:4'-phosphopantetheinyl transferase
MNLNSVDNYVRCNFDETGNNLPDLKDISVQLYFGRTEDLVPALPMLKEFLSLEERLKSDKFHFEKDRNTYILCHSLIRKIISGKLIIDPSEISIIYDSNNKPWLEGNPLFFNLSHTRDDFAFAVSDNIRIGES